MKTVIVLETAKELLDAFNPVREEGDRKPYIPLDVYLVSDAEGLSLSGKENIGILISSGVTWHDLCVEALEGLGIRFHLT